MLFITRLLMVGLLSVGIAVATTAQAGTQLFEGSWTVKAFGNECSNVLTMGTRPHCGQGASESEVYGAFGMPQNLLCNANQPRCPFVSTPVSKSGAWDPLGGGQQTGLFCEPWANWRGNGTAARPAKGETYQLATMMGGGSRVPPLYRNPVFFTPSGGGKYTFCTSTSRSPLGGKGLAQAGNPVAGSFVATTTGTQRGGFNFGSAPATGASGLRVTGAVGEFAAVFPYVYSYTYATLRNNKGIFGPGKGPGNFTVTQGQGNKDASMVVKQGAAKFGGTMTMLGALTVKVCYYRNGGCSLGENDWRYDAIGTSAQYSVGGVVTNGYVVTAQAFYYHTALMKTSTVDVEGSRFPWTTGHVTVTATGRGPHNTILYTQGFDNRKTDTPTGKGTIQLVTPVLTRWLQPGVNFETGGVGILRIKFVPEPQTWAMLIAGVSLLGVGYRMRGR